MSKTLDEFIQNSANWTSLKTVALTFDVDWAPDYMLEYVLEILAKHGLKATFFATHDSEVLKSLCSDDQFEIGLHPYVGENSSQGSSLEEAINGLRESYSTADGVRFHLLDYSYRDLIWLGQAGFRYDVSSLLFNCPFLLPAYHADLGMTLFPYMWEDGVCENQGVVPELAAVNLELPGLKIINFHPMNVFINCDGLKSRKHFQSNNPDLLSVSRSSALSFRSAGLGSGQTFKDLCGFLVDNAIETRLMGELADTFPRAVYGL